MHDATPGIPVPAVDTAPATSIPDTDITPDRAPAIPARPRSERIALTPDIHDPDPYTDDDMHDHDPVADPAPIRALEPRVRSADDTPAVDTATVTPVQLSVDRYDAADGANRYGASERLTYRVADGTADTAADALATMFRTHTGITGSVERMTYTDTDHGEERTATWVDIDGYDMDAGEFFVNGELVDTALDRYDVAPGDTISFVTADVFADPDAEICSSDVRIDDVVPDGYDAAPAYAG